MTPVVQQVVICYPNLMLCPTARRKFPSSLSPVWYSTHKLFNLCWSCPYILFFFLGWKLPISCWAITVAATRSSSLMYFIIFQMCGWWCPTRCVNRLFHPSHWLFVLCVSFIVASNTFQSHGGNLGGVRRRILVPFLKTFLNLLFT